MSLLALLAGPAALKPAIDDIVSLMLQGKLSQSEAAALVAERDRLAKAADAQAAAEANALGRAFRKGRANAA